MQTKRTEDSFLVDGHKVAITGSFVKSARLQDEYYVSLADPAAFIKRLKESGVKAAVFTFLEEITEKDPRHNFICEKQSIAVLPVTTYEHWLRDQIRFKTRNKLHKAQKAGVELRLVVFNDDLVRGIMEIYNESPIRQGKPFQHYGKDFETIKRDHETFIERSDFVGAFYRDELIGFIKFVEGKNVASLMQIISKFAHRDKAPTDALIAKAVEMCSERKIAHLHYGIWGRGGLSVFKVNHGFIRYEVPRYYVPLNIKGKLFLKLGLHRNLRDYVPERWLDYMAALRGKWTAFEHSKRSAHKSGGVISKADV